MNFTAYVLAPAISDCPSDHFTPVDTGAGDGTVFWNEPIVTDNSSATRLIFVSDLPGSPFPVGTTTVTYTYNSITGYQAICSFNVTVQEGITFILSR